MCVRGWGAACRGTRESRRPLVGRLLALSSLLQPLLLPSFLLGGGVALGAAGVFGAHEGRHPLLGAQLLGGSGRDRQRGTPCVSRGE